MRTKLIALCFAFALPMAAQTRQVQLQWNHVQDPPAVGYNVWRADGICPSPLPVPPIGFVKLNPSPLAVKNYNDSAVVVGSTYCYYATAIAGTLESVPSNTAQADITPAPPTGLQLNLAVATITVDREGVMTAKLEVRSPAGESAPIAAKAGNGILTARVVSVTPEKPE